MKYLLYLVVLSVLVNLTGIEDEESSPLLTFIDGIGAFFINFFGILVS